MILVIGEILMDMIGNTMPSSLQVEGKLGGAPFNVASDLADLDIDTLFYGVIGKDIIGDFLKSQLEKRKSCFQIDLKERENKATTIAFFLKDKKNFQFLRKEGADYAFTKDDLLSLPYQKAKIIHFGSLFLSDQKARDTIFTCIKGYKKEGNLISFDVNFRSDIFQEKEDFIPYYLEMTSYSDIIKFTKEEILMLTKKKELKDAISFFKDKKIILITDGENGSYCYYKDKLYYEPSKKVVPVDTIGCGDSFMAGCLSYLYQHDINSLTEEEIHSLLKRGNECGKRTCLVLGAIHAYQSLKDLEGDYENH